MKPTHDQRINAAARAIDSHGDGVRSFDLTDEQRVTDLLTSLRHHCQANDLDFTGLVRASNAQFQHE